MLLGLEIGALQTGERFELLQDVNVTQYGF
jgi:hypothetical protein